MEIQELINTVIATQVVTALNDSPDAVEKLVRAALSKPVAADGSYQGYGNKMPYLEWLVGDEIRRATELIVRKIIQEHTDVIETDVRKELTSERIVGAVMESLVGAAKKDWNISVKFEAEPDRRY